MNELTFDELRQIDGGSYEEGRELGHKIGKHFMGPVQCMECMYSFAYRRVIWYCNCETNVLF